MKFLNINISDDKLTDFCQRWQIQELALFGSVLREDFRPDSDVDVLVTFMPDNPWSLFDFVEMKEELEQLFERKVDLVSRWAIEHSHNVWRRRAILDSAEVVYVSA
jgi:uncharacterized protein